MGMRSPQEMQQVEAAPERSTRMSGSPAPQINPQFLTTISEANQLREQARLKQEEKEYKFVKASAEVQAQKFRLEAEAKLASKRGADAFKEEPKIREELFKKVSGVVSAVPEKFREDISREIPLEVESSYNRSAIPYQYAQGRALRESVLKDRVTLMSQDIIQNGADAEYLDKVSIGKLYQAAIDYAESEYGDLDAVTPDGFTGREAALQMARMTVSKSLTDAAIGQAQLGSLDRSEGILTKFAKEITEPDRLRALKAIEKAKADGTNGMAMSMARLAIETYGDDIVSIQRTLEQQSRGNMDLYKTSMAFVTSVKGAEKKAKELRRQESFANAIQSIEAGGALTPEMIKTLDERDVPKLKQYAVDFASGKMTVTDQAVYNKLMNVVLDDPQKLINGEVNLQAAKASLNKEDYRMFESIQTQLSKDQSKEALRVANRGYRVATDVVTNYLNTKGLTDPASVGAAKNYAMTYVNELLELNPKVSGAEIRKKLQQRLAEGGTKIVEEKTWFGLFTNEYEAPAEIKPRVKENIRQEIIKRKGALTEDQILNVAKELQKKAPNLDLFE